MTDHQIRSGTLTGTILTILGNIQTGDIIKTAILAAVGALVSFLVAKGLRIMFKQPSSN